MRQVRSQNRLLGTVTVPALGHLPAGSPLSKNRLAVTVEQSREHTNTKTQRIRSAVGDVREGAEATAADRKEESISRTVTTVTQRVHQPSAFASTADPLCTFSTPASGSLGGRPAFD